MPKKQLNFLQKLHLRETMGSTQIHSKTRPLKFFHNLPLRLAFSLQELVSYAVLKSGHVFLGFTKNGQFVLSYTMRLESDAVTLQPIYAYKLHFWLFVPYKPLKKVAEVSLFGDQDISSELYIAVCEWPTDKERIVIHACSLLGSSTAHTKPCYLTVTAMPVLTRCENCDDMDINLESDESDDVSLSDWFDISRKRKCIRHAFTLHAKYALVAPFPAFSAAMSLKKDGVIVINTGDTIIALNADIYFPGRNKTTLKKGQASSLLSLNDEYPEDLTDNEDLISDVASAPPSDCDHQLSLAQPPCCSQCPAPCACQKTRLKHHHTESRTSGWLNHLSMDNDASNPSGSCYELSSLNVDHEKIGVSYRNWAKNKKELKKVNNGFAFELTVDGCGGDTANGTRAKSSCSLSPRPSTSGRGEVTTTADPYDFNGTDFTATMQPKFKPLPKSPRKFMNSHNSSEDYLDRVSQVMGSPQVPSCRRDLSAKENVSPETDSSLRAPYSAVKELSPHASIKEMSPLPEMYMPAFACMTKRVLDLALLSPSVPSASSSDAGSLYSVPVRQSCVTWTKKVFYDGVGSDRDSNAGDFEDEEVGATAYHHLPIEAYGANLLKLQALPPNRSEKLLDRPSIVVQHITFDVEFYIHEIAQKICNDSGKKYLAFTDYDIEIIDVCPVTGDVILLAMMLLQATVKSKGLSRSQRICNSIVRKVYQTGVRLVWNIETGKYTLIDNDELREVDASQLARKQATLWNPAVALCRTLQKEWFIPQAPMKSVSVRNNDAVIKRQSLKYILEPYHHVALIF